MLIAEFRDPVEASLVRAGEVSAIIRNAALTGVWRSLTCGDAACCRTNFEGRNHHGR
jgi:hypothetical protein